MANISAEDEASLRINADNWLIDFSKQFSNTCYAINIITSSIEHISFTYEISALDDLDAIRITVKSNVSGDISCSKTINVDDFGRMIRNSLKEGYSISNEPEFYTYIKELAKELYSIKSDGAYVLLTEILNSSNSLIYMNGKLLCAVGDATNSEDRFYYTNAVDVNSIAVLDPSIYIDLTQKHRYFSYYANLPETMNLLRNGGYNPITDTNEYHFVFFSSIYNKVYDLTMYYDTNYRFKIRNISVSDDYNSLKAVIVENYDQLEVILNNVADNSSNNTSDLLDFLD